MATAVATSPRLAQLEETIGRGLETFVEVGEALREIRDSGLYKEADPSRTFEDYCDQRWAMSRPRAYELMQSATVVSAIADTGIEPPRNEAQARPLAQLRERPEEMTAAWEEASAGGEPTAAKVKEAVSRRMDVHYSSATDEWATPQDLFDKLDAEFKFELDVCALDSSAKSPFSRHFSTTGGVKATTGTSSEPASVVSADTVSVTVWSLPPPHPARSSAANATTPTTLFISRLSLDWLTAGILNRSVRSGWNPAQPRPSGARGGWALDGVCEAPDWSRRAISV
jgi:hypothetical protein